MEVDDDYADLRCQQRARLLENKLSFDQQPQTVTGRVRYPGTRISFAHPNPREFQQDAGGPLGGGRGTDPSNRRQLGASPRSSPIRPTDRLREQTRPGQLKAPVHQRLHRPTWHTMKQLKHRVVRLHHPVPAGLSESALTCDNDQGRPARRCAMRSSRWRTETAARTS